MGDIDEEVLADRTSMGEGGLISITVVIDNRTGRPLERPTVQAKGFSEDHLAMMPEVTDLVENTMLDLAGKGENEVYRMVQKLRRTVSRYVEQKWRRKPMIIPTVVPTAGEVHVSDEDIAAARQSL